MRGQKTENAARGATEEAEHTATRRQHVATHANRVDVAARTRLAELCSDVDK